jgi:hypothetical protein
MQAMPRTDAILFLALCLGFSTVLPAQDKAAEGHATPATPALQHGAKIEAQPHRFWDPENAWLFAGVGAARMLDYASTRHFRGQGINELLLTNSVVDNRPLFVGIELVGTAASIGVSYLFHRTGHHRAERWISIVHIGVAAGGSIRNYALTPPASTH